VIVCQCEVRPVLDTIGGVAGRKLPKRRSPQFGGRPYR
jgi:hypothetical protein